MSPTPTAKLHTVTNAHRCCVTVTDDEALVAENARYKEREDQYQKGAERMAAVELENAQFVERLQNGAEALEWSNGEIFRLRAAFEALEQEIKKAIVAKDTWGETEFGMLRVRIRKYLPGDEGGAPVTGANEGERADSTPLPPLIEMIEGALRELLRPSKEDAERSRALLAVANAHARVAHGCRHPLPDDPNNAALSDDKGGVAGSSGSTPAPVATPSSTSKWGVTTRACGHHWTGPPPAPPCPRCPPKSETAGPPVHGAANQSADDAPLPDFLGGPQSEGSCPECNAHPDACSIHDRSIRWRAVHHAKHDPSKCDDDHCEICTAVLDAQDDEADIRPQGSRGGH